MVIPRRGLAITLACVLSCVVEVAAQPARFEVDHVFGYTPPGAAAEIEALRELGFFVDTLVSKHSGQGTASRGVLFDNAYFELIWIDSSVAVSEKLRGIQEEMRNASAWRATGVSPFGLGLRRIGADGDIGVPFTRLSGDWMRPGSFIALLRQPSEPGALDMFIVPEYMALPAWIEMVRQQAPQVLSHPNGARRITGVEILAPRAHHARAADLLKVDGFRSVEADEPFLILELDGGTRGETMDLRPLLPVIFRR